MDWQASIESLRSDNSSGAAEIARRAVDVMRQWLARPESGDLDHWRAAFEAFGHRLCAAQPAMAPLFHLVNDALLAAEAADTLADAERTVLQVTEAFLRQLDQAQEQLLAVARPVLAKSPRILTISYSSSVLAVLRGAHAGHMPLEVFCTEGRPVMEGRRMAQGLAEAGVPVTLGVDAALSAFVTRASLVLVGADSIARDGVLNKLGTTGVSLAARAAGVPCYVLASRQKWFPSLPTAMPAGEPRPPGEVWPDAPPGVTVWNIYFERTPLERFSGFIAEQGVLAPQELIVELSRMRIASAWQHSAEQTGVGEGRRTG